MMKGIDREYVLRRARAKDGYGWFQSSPLPFKQKHAIREAGEGKLSRKTCQATANKSQSPTSVVANAQTSSARASRKQHTLANVQQFVFWTSDRIQVKTVVEKLDSSFNVSISVNNQGSPNSALKLQWGLFRTSPAKWFTPDEVSVSSRSEPSGSGKGRTAELTQQRDGSREIRFSVPAKLAPVYLAFKLLSTQANAKPVEHKPAQHLQHFAVPLGLGQCNPLLLGASLGAAAPDGKSHTVNFAVNSRNATAVSLCIARRKEDGQCGGYLEIALDPLVNRKGDAWHVSLEGLKDLGSLCYGWRADADISWDQGNRFHPGQVMLDPFAKMAVQVYLPEGVNVPPPSKGLPSSRPLASNPPAYMGCLGSLTERFDWQDVRRPNIALEKSVVVELHIPRFSRGSKVPQQHQGRFFGVLDRLQDLERAGVTAVMLTPVTLSGEGLGPFGRAPFSFLAPEPSLATGTSPDAASQELKILVKELHARDIEVFLQVPYSLTGEGWDESASAVSLRGLDAAVYYRSKGVLNCGHAVVRSLILASLKHWLREYQVDGFCFLHAETLALDRDGNVLDNPPLAEDIAYDSELKAAKLIAWAADDTLLPRKGQRGFPHWAIWQERNKRFTFHFNQFFKDHRPADIASSIATRICGSADLFGRDQSSGFPGTLAAARRPCFGYNSASVLDSAPLSETVASILSPMAPPEHHQILKRSLLFASMMSGGVPLIGADVLDDTQLTSFVGELKQLRLQLSSCLYPITFDCDWSVQWYGAHPGGQPDWDGELARAGVPAAAYLAYTAFQPDGLGIYIAYNPYEGPVPAILPSPPNGCVWKRAVDTGDDTNPALSESKWISLSSADYTVTAKGALLLVAVPQQPSYTPQSSRSSFEDTYRQETPAYSSY